VLMDVERSTLSGTRLYEICELRQRSALIQLREFLTNTASDEPIVLEAKDG
jgi:hypothetical protein